MVPHPDPGVPIIAYCGAGVDASQDILDLSCTGIHELLFRGVNDDPLRMRAALDAGLRASAATRTLALVLPHVPSVLHGIVEYTVHHPELATTVEAVADGLGVHRKTLVNQCTRVGFPPPGFVIGWSRLLHASVLLSTTRRPVDHIARALAFPSGTALRNMMRRYTSYRPSELRATTGAERLLERFKATMRAADHAPVQRRVFVHAGL